MFRYSELIILNTEPMSKEESLKENFEKIISIQLKILNAMKRILEITKELNTITKNIVEKTGEIKKL